MKSPFLVRFVLAAFLVALFAQSRRALALEPSEIALIVNSNEPAGRDLAQFYAQARHIPDNRILELSLPSSEEMPFEEYEEIVVPQVREFLRTGNLEQSVKCFVTFYGVPIRIGPRLPDGADSREQASMRQELLKAATHVAGAVQMLEKLATQLNPDFTPNPSADLEALAVRTDVAARNILIQIRTVPDERRRTELLGQFYSAMQALVGQSAQINRVAIEQALKATSQPTTQPVQPKPSDIKALQVIKTDYDNALKRMAELEQLRFDPGARSELRLLCFKHFGFFGYVHVLQDHVAYLETEDTSAGFDNELALVHWTAYPRAKWRDNPLYYGSKKPRGTITYMVMRLDAPKPEMVKDIITSSIKAETEGLKGKVVLDSRGIQLGHEKENEKGYAQYDQSLRDLGDMIQKHTKLQLMADDNPDVLPPRSADDVALYCGWYSLHTYVPECKFNPGAIGYHMASFEMITLHKPNDTGWAAGLLNDGVAATFEPVAEPYLQAFPQPHEFFPLLLTGKLTLAEAYWDTIRMTSWRMCAIGDPLYTPYKANPALAVEDLPKELRVCIAPPAPAPVLP